MSDFTPEGLREENARLRAEAEAGLINQRPIRLAISMGGLALICLITMITICGLQPQPNGMLDCAKMCGEGRVRSYTEEYSVPRDGRYDRVPEKCECVVAP